MKERGKEVIEEMIEGIGIEMFKEMKKIKEMKMKLVKKIIVILVVMEMKENFVGEKINDLKMIEY